jgi:hypothetical protein
MADERGRCYDTGREGGISIDMPTDVWAEDLQSGVVDDFVAHDLAIDTGVTQRLLIPTEGLDNMMGKRTW